MSETKVKYIDFYNDGSKEVLVEVDFGTLRWVSYNVVASYIRKLSDQHQVLAKGSDRIRSQAAMDVLETLGRQLLLIADSVENGPPPPEEQTVTLKPSPELVTGV